MEEQIAQVTKDTAVYAELGQKTYKEIVDTWFEGTAISVKINKMHTGVWCAWDLLRVLVFVVHVGCVCSKVLV